MLTELQKAFLLTKNKNKYQGNRIRKRKIKRIIRKNNGDCLLKSDIKSHRQCKFESSKRLNWTAKYCDFKTILNTNEREWLISKLWFS